ncbi:AbrB/MazE/SpoVT family DNA-binding domain-containing protein, partial [Bacillaceae bacterium Marseille-Q3522]|nr:AbrB/MazE/SpoVT family DNA-binding domain-containing protein [Bacillaceae bacterium Marseille-Q3522]
IVIYLHKNRIIIGGKAMDNLNNINESPKNGEDSKMTMLTDRKQDNSIELKGKMKVSSKGQVVIPVEVRKAIGIQAGGQELSYHYKNGKMVLELVKYLSADELLGFFDTAEDNGDFVLDLHQAREDRATEILKKGI